MGILVVIADPNDGSVRSTGVKDENNDHIQIARDGADLQSDPYESAESGRRLAIGGYQTGNHIGAVAIRAQTFMEFKPEGGLVLPLSQVDVVSGSFRGTRFGYEYPTNDPGPDSAQLWCRPWSPPVSSQWYPMQALLNNIFTGIDSEVLDFMRIRRGSSAVYSPAIPEPELYEAGGDLFRQNLIAALAANGPFQLLSTLGNPLGRMQDQSKAQLATWTASNYQTESKNKPTVIVRSIKKHALQSVGQSSIQMTDGTAVFLRREMVSGSPVINLYYQRINSTVPVLIKKIPTTSAEHADNYYAVDPGFQSFGLTRDNSNNLFLVGVRGAVQQQGNHFHRLFNVNGFRYNGNYSWTYFNPTTMGENGQVASNSFYTHRGLPNNFAPVWLPDSSFGVGGQLVVFHSRRDGQWAGYQLGAASLYAPWLIGMGTPGKNHKTGYAMPYSTPYSDWRPFNSSGTGLDATAGPQTDRVYAASFVQADSASTVERAGVDTFQQSGSHVTNGLSFPTTRALNSPHDPDAKIRSIWMGDSSPYYAWMVHGTIQLYKIADDSLYRSIDFTTAGLNGFPSKETLQGSQGWDVIWDNNRNIFWIYYVDSLNQRNIRKFSYDHINNVISTSAAVAGPLGASGSRIEALRLPRQKTDIRCFLIDVGMRDGNLAPVYPAIHLRDISNNAPPLAPTLPLIESFNATVAKQVDYTFNDPNVGDYATAHEIEIKRVSTGLNVVTSGKVSAGNVSGTTYRYTIAANALTNDTQYQMRIRNYDSVDSVGPWSEWKSFSTSATGGTVVVIQPANDLEPLNRSSILLKWTYSNTNPARVQNGYQVRIYNDLTNAIISDTTIIASTATERNIPNLQSDIQYRIEVQVRDTSGALSGAGIRIVRPDYDNPSIPTIAVTPMKGYIEIRVTNPPPTGDNPVTVSNQIARKEKFELDSAYKIIGTCPINGVYEDYTVASGVEYSYKVRGSST